MAATVVVGGFYGDEGKGKVVAYLALAGRFRAVVRGGVGPNAGHTVTHQGMDYRLRMVPSGFINPEVRLMIGAGVLVDPNVLLGEVERLGLAGRLLVDERCAIIEGRHRSADRRGHLREVVGTTGTGTGPANADRVLRRARLAREVAELKGLLGDVAREVNRILEEGGEVLLEGTQGTFLSLYHGTYPYVTSKDVTAASICADVGVGPKRVGEVVVVFKAYVTRVGGGPLQGELSLEEARARGWAEYGTVTGRQRRAAPFDFELARRAVMLNSATQVALTKLDVLYPECKGARRPGELGSRAREFVERVGEELGVPVTLVGTGPEAEDMVDLR